MEFDLLEIVRVNNFTGFLVVYLSAPKETIDKVVQHV